ncbi:preprotein translocase subunit SecG [Akkermansiaceae bacterium]|nr:preprotein translocase subunit SecG [Akkermansiaceae bacterium]MDB4265992.1 preprotein translocase subunit SecG [bacterium]MDA7862789.1 preprotein translocase subunit SecG [Akkermansiaceae bacterium]MDA7863933.1 preprotein translocase subunit SecG [Akkermansiaceae bacterium]MDA8875845.1 preprotein translocase subunit SecG [Akkermansiaceae bacterium]
MTLAFLDIGIWIKLVIIAHVVVSALLILVILMQRPKQEGLGAAFGSGATDAVWGARTTDVLQRATVYLGTLFFVFSLVLAILVGKKNETQSKRADSDGAEKTIEKVEEETPDLPVSASPDVNEEFKKQLEAAKGAATSEPVEAPEAVSEPVVVPPLPETPAEVPAEPVTPPVVGPGE